MLSMDDLFKGRQFDREIIILCVRWYLRFKLSLARQAHLNDRDQRAVLFKCRDGSAAIVWLWHGALHRFVTGAENATLAGRPIVSRIEWPGSFLPHIDAAIGPRFDRRNTSII
jgi:hypothetical protein